MLSVQILFKKSPISEEEKQSSPILQVENQFAEVKIVRQLTH